VRESASDWKPFQLFVQFHLLEANQMVVIPPLFPCQQAFFVKWYTQLNQELTNILCGRVASEGGTPAFRAFS